MKRTILTLLKMQLFVTLFLSTFLAESQENPSLEQVAWEFFNEKVFKGYQLKKKPVFWGPVETHCYLFYDTVSAKKLQFDILNTKKRTYRAGIVKFTYTHADQFKIKDAGKGGYPRIYLTFSFSNKEDQQIVTIIEEHKDKSIFYHIEMTDNGQVKNWCEGTEAKHKTNEMKVNNR
jgi:hypothetical protein